MARRLAAIVIIVLFLSGCTQSNDSLHKAVSLRDTLLSADGCSFHAEIAADYGDNVYAFSMDCIADKAGNLTFTVTEPESIAGIKGNITAEGGKITFDDKVLIFQTMADGQITPVSAPWVFIKTLRSGYLNSCSKNENGYQISIDDSYQDDALHLNIWVKDDLPVAGEIFWQGRRVLTLTVEEFTYL